MVYVINGTEHVLVEMPVSDSNRNQITKLCEKHNCIVQGFDVIKFLFFSKIKIKLLVPSASIHQFQKEYEHQ